MSMAKAIILSLAALVSVPAGHDASRPSYLSDRTHGTYGTHRAISIAVAVGQASPAAATDARSPATKQDLQVLLEEANAAFRQANATEDRDQARRLYEQAILLYEKIIVEGDVQNAKLYYNLGNAYLLKDDLGRAILNYRRAETLDGSDLNIRKNLAFARSRRIDRVAPGAERRVLETLFFWHYDFSLRTRFLLACLAFAGLSLALTAMLWLGRGPVNTTVAVATAALLLALVGSVAVEADYRAETRFGVITAAEVVARQGDGPNYPPSFKDPLHAGTEFELVEQRPGWLHIQLSDGTDAWIPDHAAGIV